MRKFLATILVVGLVFATLGGLPALGDDGEPSQAIGRYERITGNGDLTDNHVAQTASGLQIEGPSFTNTLRVDTGFLESELGSGWSASAAFSLDGDHVVFEGRKADFSPLEIGANPVFTMGSRDQIEFQERPMWVSVDQGADGETIILDMDDGDTTGQPVYIAREWLWSHGIHRPVAVHEDETNLTAVATEERDGWMIDMHHFTYVEINPKELEVMGRQAGIVFPHPGDRLWNEEKKILDVEVEEKEDDYEVLIDKDWVDMNIPYPDVLHHTWTVEFNKLATDYYVVALAPEDTPTTLHLQPHLQMIDVEDPFYNDPYQEFKAINETSLKLALATGNLTITILGEELFIKSKYEPNEVYWESTTNESGFFTEEIYVVANNDPEDEMVGEIRFVDEYFSVSMVFNSTGKLGSYIGINNDISQSLGGIQYRGIHFYDPINFMLDVPNTPEYNSTAGEEDSQTEVLGLPMKYVAYIDETGMDQIMEGGGTPTSERACLRASAWHPISTAPFRNVGVTMSRSACYTDPNGVRLDSSDKTSASTTLKDYTRQFQDFPLGDYNGDIIMFVSGLEFTLGRGAGWLGPGNIWDSDDKGRRYSVTTINDDKYPNDVDNKWASTIVLLHEMGHNLRADHHHAAYDVQCDRAGPDDDPATGITLMADNYDNNEALTGQYCFMFSDERHSPIGYPGQETQSAMALQYGSVIYEARPDDWW